MLLPLQQLAVRLTRPSMSEFRAHALQRSAPAIIFDLFSDHAEQLPAIHKWFEMSKDLQIPLLKTDYLKAWGKEEVQVEVNQGRKHEKDFWVQKMAFASFVQVTNATARSSTNLEDDLAKDMSEQLYLAQYSISNLNRTLQADLPAPDLVRAGREQLQANAIWLGLAPTYTPLHKDPDDNLFVQMAGHKTVRLLEPDMGLQFYTEAQRRQGIAPGSAVRGPSMMMGEERKILEDLVWNNDEQQSADYLYEETLGPGETLYIPKGWWHSIKGIGRGVTGSVNWWFR